MKLTLNLRKDLVLAAEAEARRCGCTLSDLAVEGLRKVLGELTEKHRKRNAIGGNTGNQ